MPWIKRSNRGTGDHFSRKLTPSLCRQLMENQISVVERGAFDDMKELERL